jgi:hypothetical protein
LNVLVSATDSGAFTNSGIVNVVDGGTLTLGAAVITNGGSIRLQGTSGGSGATLLIDANVTLSGGGTLSMSSSGNNFIIDSGATVSLTNISNTIVGAGMIGDNNLDLTLNNRGTINGNGGGLTIDAAFVSNGGTLESTASGGLTIDADVSNTKTIAALGSGATLHIVNHLISGNGTAFASGPHAEIDLAGAIFFGGTLKTRQRRQNCHQRQLLQRSHDRRKLIRGNPERRYARAAGDDDRRWSNRRVDSGGVLSLQFGTIGAGAASTP